MVSLLQDFFRFRRHRVSGPRLKVFTWRSCFVFATGLGFLVTVYRTYMAPPYSRPTDQVGEVEFGVPDRKVDWAARADAVKQAFAHAYHGYETYAFPEDQLLPLTNTSAMK